MSFDAEWEQIKKEVATAGVTRLASAGDGGGRSPGGVQARNDTETGEQFSRCHGHDEQRLTDGFNRLDDHAGYADTDFMPMPGIQWEG